jgi:uncharacterized protein (TIGR02284 family)
MPTTLPLPGIAPADTVATEQPHATPGMVPPPSGYAALAVALTRTLDARAGFQKMAEHAEPDFAPIVEAYLDLHTRHGETLTRLLAEAGHNPDDEGSLMGTVNRLVVATRAIFDDIDADILAEIHSGEAHVVAAFQDALSGQLPDAVRTEVAELLAELNALLADTRPLD